MEVSATVKAKVEKARGAASATRRRRNPKSAHKSLRKGIDD